MSSKGICVEFFHGPLDGALRYYSSVRVAKSVARRYVKKYFTLFGFRPFCEICAVSESGGTRFLCSIW